MSPEVKKFNAHAIPGLDADVAMLEEMCNVLPMRGVAQARPLAEVRQFVRLMTAADGLEHVAAAKDPVAALDAEYPALRPPHRLAALLDKYREVGIAATLFAGRSASAEAQKHPKRKTVEALVKRLRAAKG